MVVTILLFASYAEAVGVPSVKLDVPPGATVSEVLELVRALPGAGALPPGPLVAVNESYAAEGHPLAPGDEVAIIPPVAGG
ncbi:MAG TPA: molybdopterin converting factor subunit 1 [Gemmatimonadaceae bacterium]|nr:molybdopterin converting factor subunit 1 [Gemmatimonadaceae bacterium]